MAWSLSSRTGLRATMPDGVELVADCWHPDGQGPWPVLLQRLPYGRSVASTPVLPHPSWFARHGYAVVVQDCRGRGDSGGTFAPFVHEGPDGAASVEWAAGLPFSPPGDSTLFDLAYAALSAPTAAVRAASRVGQRPRRLLPQMGDRPLRRQTPVPGLKRL